MTGRDKNGFPFNIKDTGVKFGAMTGVERIFALKSSTLSKCADSHPANRATMSPSDCEATTRFQVSKDGTPFMGAVPKPACPAAATTIRFSAVVGGIPSNGGAGDDSLRGAGVDFLRTGNFILDEFDASDFVFS